MQDLKEAPIPAATVITLNIHMIDGTTFVQDLPVDDADGAQDFLNWFRQPGRIKVWTWQVPVMPFALAAPSPHHGGGHRRL
ncbi:hypothetical protein [Cohnella cellulosilytica]|uniref:hypothetical protein n=1 Tax=Cohnella cellulosilytica TaxID=986710 RepID=UPI0036174239